MIQIHSDRSAGYVIDLSASTTEHPEAGEKEIAEAKKDNQLGFMVRG